MPTWCVKPKKYRTPEFPCIVLIIHVLTIHQNTNQFHIGIVKSQRAPTPTYLPSFVPRCFPVMTERILVIFRSDEIIVHPSCKRILRSRGINASWYCSSSSVRTDKQWPPFREIRHLCYLTVGWFLHCGIVFLVNNSACNIQLCRYY